MRTHTALIRKNSIFTLRLKLHHYILASAHLKKSFSALWLDEQLQLIKLMEEGVVWVCAPCGLEELL